MIARIYRASAVCGAGLLLTSHVVTADSQPPTAPMNLSAQAVSSSEIRLSWDPSSDNRRVRHYEIKRNNVWLATTRKTQFTNTGLSPATSYTFSIFASDGVNVSPEAVYTVATLDADPGADTDSKKPGKGNGKKDNPEDPPAEEPPVVEPPIDEPPVEEPPVSGGAPTGWQLVFNDDFDGSGDLDVSSSERLWRFETMDDGLHRAGNTGIDALGNPVASWDSVRGKRWSAWYNGYNAANVYRENGNLVMGGYHSGESDPTRPVDYVDNGVLTRYGQSKLYTGWIDTFSRKWVGPGGLHVVDPDSPGISFKYGYFETRVKFSEMKTPGFRLSLWLMPASTDAEGQDLVVSKAYDADGNNGVEIDLFEYEWIGEEFGSRIHLALLGGAAGSSHRTLDAATMGFDLRESYHTIGLLWEADRLIWTINGEVAKEVYDPALIPDVYSYLVFSREMNSGVKNPDLDSVDDTDVMEEWPYRPRDPGLYAKNVWEFRDRINLDRAIIDYIRVWQP